MRKTFAVRCPVCGLPSNEADWKKYVKRKGLSKLFFSVTRILRSCTNCRITFSVYRAKILFNQLAYYYNPRPVYIRRKQKYLPAPEAPPFTLRPANLRSQINEEYYPQTVSNYPETPPSTNEPIALQEDPHLGFHFNFAVGDSNQFGKQVKKKLASSIEMIASAIDSLNQVEGLKSWNLSYQKEKTQTLIPHKTSQDD